MYAIVETGGKQYRVSEGDEIFVEKLAVEAGDSFKLDKVLAVGENDKIRFGTPYIDGCSVDCEVLKQGKGKKITIFKYKAKKNYRRKKGHRQPYTKLKITAVNV
ncbi:MAG: 50S ribosomal protein L21 [Eubacteriales bacterium]|nr:50S ribosomal protein L21 [Eubacteriales bacterium]